MAQDMGVKVEISRNECRLIDPLLWDLARAQSLLLEALSDLFMPPFVAAPRLSYLMQKD